MGGKSSSSSSSATTTNTTVTDKRMVLDGGSLGISADGSNINVQSVDANIVQSALDTVKANDATNGEGFQTLVNAQSDGYAKLINATQDMNTSSSNSFGQLIGFAENLFSRGADLIDQGQKATIAQVEALNAVATDQKGTIDQKTMIVLAVAGAAAIVLSRNNQ